MTLKTGLFIFLGLLVTGFIFIGIGVNASSSYPTIENYGSTALAVDTEYTLDQMLTYAIQDEYLAQATYAAIIDTYGEIRPFTNIVNAEQTHIDMLLPLFETYGVAVPVNDASQYVVVPDSVSSALATGIEAEKANILLYQTFIEQGNLPSDVEAVFNYLISASEHHLNAFSKERVLGAGYDLAQMFKHQFKSGNADGSGSQNAFRGSKGQGQSQSQSGTCINN